MALGFGFLKQMNETIKYNRDLLGKKKSVREMYKDEIRRQGTAADGQNLAFVRQRVADALKRNRATEAFLKAVAISGLVIFVLGVVWAFIVIDLTPEKKSKYEDKANLFKTVIYIEPNGLKLKQDYFFSGPKAAETYLKDDLKHQNSESFYESGEQFRSALYYNDTLVRELYFYKTGDTIHTFPKVTDSMVYHIELFDKKRLTHIEFDFYDGKVIQGTYVEKKSGLD
jgi:hypothetical protein